MARRASPGYNRVAGTNAIGSDTQEDGVTLLPRALTFGAGAGSTQLVIQGAPTSTWPFRLGSIIGVTGANMGQSRTIYGFASGQTVSVKLAFLNPVSPGDEFQILPGCDRTMATCINVFNNTQLGQGTGRFGGFPFVPLPETAV
jgi:hypothetical protein